MMDQFMEEVVTKQKRGFQGLLLAVANVMMIVLALIAVLVLILIFGEITPKVLAKEHAIGFALRPSRASTSGNSTRRTVSVQSGSAMAPR